MTHVIHEEKRKGISHSGPSPGNNSLEDIPSYANDSLRHFSNPGRERTFTWRLFTFQQPMAEYKRSSANLPFLSRCLILLVLPVSTARWSSSGDFSFGERHMIFIGEGNMASTVKRPITRSSANVNKRFQPIGVGEIHEDDFIWVVHWFDLTVY